MVSAAVVPQLRCLLALYIRLTASTSHWLINNGNVAYSSLKKRKLLLQQHWSSRLSSGGLIIIMRRRIILVTMDKLNCAHHYNDNENYTDFIIIIIKFSTGCIILASSGFVLISMITINTSYNNQVTLFVLLVVLLLVSLLVMAVVFHA